jgi:hypothetical protein
MGTIEMKKSAFVMRRVHGGVCFSKILNRGKMWKGNLFCHVLYRLRGEFGGVVCWL